ncbi:MAG: CSLREA domain-containing protein, partial [Actinomycetota bacterium]
MRRSSTAVVVALLAATLIGVAAEPEPAAAQSSAIVVDSAGDQADGDPTDGTCRTSAGTCTLRAAIAEANARPGPDRIFFAIPGSGVKTIDAATPLPTIDDATGALTIDGYTQPGATPNTAAAGSNAAIRIQIAGPAGGHLFRIRSAANEIRGLAIYRANIVVQIDGEEADGNRIVGNFIGTDAAGTYENPVGVTGGNTGVGVLIELGPDRNVIGAPGPADRNVISGNGGYAVRINHGETSEHRIQNNVVGLNPSLTAKLRQVHGIDLQWWTWGNLIGGDDPSEANLVGGHITRAGIELSHAAQSNLVIGNLIGTMPDGDSVTAFSGNTYGIALKDDPFNNYIADNVIGGNGHGVYHKHNYTRRNTFVNNRIGVGLAGGAIPNTIGTNLNGLDQLWFGNVFANQNQHVQVVDYLANRAAFFVDTYTRGNAVRQSQFHNPGTRADPYVDLAPNGVNPNDPGDRDEGRHDLLNSPELTGVGPGKVFGTACAGCEVEVYVSGPLRRDGTIDTSGTAAGVGLAWIATVTAAADGTFSLGDPRIAVGRTLSALTIDAGGNTSELPVGTRVPSAHAGVNGTAGSAGSPPSPPPRLPLPPPYEPVDQSFSCSAAGGTLTWTDAGAAEYYVFATTDGVERYLGGHRATSLAVGDADSYRVEHWLTGRARNAICDGPGVPSNQCSVSGSTLSWVDVGAAEYYVFATVDGVERYLGGHAVTSLTVAPADSY